MCVGSGFWCRCGVSGFICLSRKEEGRGSRGLAAQCCTNEGGGLGGRLLAVRALHQVLQCRVSGVVRVETVEVLHTCRIKRNTDKKTEPFHSEPIPLHKPGSLTANVVMC